MSACPRPVLLLALWLGACAAEPTPRHRLFAESGPGPVHRHVRFADVVSPGERARLQDLGITLLLRRGQGWWLAKGPLAAFDGLTGRHGVVQLRRPAAEEKLSPRLRRRLAAADGDDVLALWVMLSLATEPGERSLALLEAAAEQAEVRRVAFAPIFELRCRASDLPGLAALDPVRHLDLPPGPAVPLLDQSRKAIGVESLHDIDATTSPPTYALAGQGTVGGIWDPNGVEPTHGDLEDNLLRYPDPSVPSSLSHGTAVGGCLAGSGARSAAPPGHPWAPYQLRGMAPAARLAMYVTDGETDSDNKPTTFIEQYLEARQTYKVDVLSFSFSHTGHATYDSATANLDFLIRRSSAGLPEPVPIVVASGNEAWKYGYGAVTSMASGKNVLAVGASDWASGDIVSFSSFGPTDDGRLKPEVMAPGCASHGKTKVGVDSVRVIPAQGTALEWTFDSDVEGWSVVRHLSPLSVIGGELQATTTGDDPGIYSPDNLGLDPTQYTKIEVTMRVDRHHRAELYWKTDKGDFHGSRSRSFFVNADGQLHTYVVDLSDHKQWKDTIERLRIDPITTGIALPAPGDTYATSCGTSMSTPIAAGGILLLVQAWREALPGEPRPSPAMLRALLAGTARDMVGQGPGGNPDLSGAPTPYPAGPDHATGYGEIQIDRAVEVIRAAGQGRRGLLESTVPYTGREVGVRIRLAQAMSEALRVTLAWDDPPGEPGSAAVLQNDLDLSVLTPGGEQLLPWVLDPTQPTLPATRGVDRRGNLEQVSIPAPAAGDYLVTVAGHELAQGPQGFALVLSDASALVGLTIDADGDGAFADADCDDTDPGVHPGAVEVTGNGKDDDCDPSTSDSPLSPDAGAPEAGAGSDGAPDATLEIGGGGGCSVGSGRSVGAPLSVVLFFVILVLQRRRAC